MYSVATNFSSPQYGTKALDKITKAILGHIENKVPPPKGYPGGDAMFFRGIIVFFSFFCFSILDDGLHLPMKNFNTVLVLTIFFFILDMKLGMMDVGIFCRESRFGLSTEKGKSLFTVF